MKFKVGDLVKSTYAGRNLIGIVIKYIENGSNKGDYLVLFNKEKTSNYNMINPFISYESELIKL